MNPILLSTTTGGSPIGIIFLLVCLAAFAAFAMWFYKLLKKVSDLVPLLMEDPDAYIVEMELLAKSFIPANLKAMLIMNIAVAHMEKNDYKTALQTMARAKATRLKKDTSAVYFLNLAHIYVQLGENKKAYGIIDANKKKFNRLPSGGNLPALTAFVFSFIAMENGSWAEATELLTYSKETWTEHIPGVDFAILYDRLDAHQAEI